MSSKGHRISLVLSVAFLSLLLSEADAPSAQNSLSGGRQPPETRKTQGALAPRSGVETASKPTPKQIEQWIGQLGDNSFKVRENASKKLWTAGQAAEAALSEAIKSEDAEVARRARDLLDKFRWGIYPDTPADIVALIRAYQSSEGNTRVEILQKLLQGGSSGLRAVLRISTAEKDPLQRKVLSELVSGQLAAALPQLFEDGDYNKFEALLEIVHDAASIDDQPRPVRDANSNDNPHRQYAAYWLLRGKLDERIAHFNGLLAKTPKEKRFAETLVYLHRAKGDLKSAIKSAEKAERADLIEGLLYESADWKALAVRPDLTGMDSPIEKAAYRAAFARLAGNRKDAGTYLDDLAKLSGKEVELRSTYRFAAAKAFFLNDRPTEGAALLAKTSEYQTILFEILCARLQYRKAMDLVDQPRPGESIEQKQLEILKARTLYLLGEKDKGRALFVRLGERIKEDDGVDTSLWIDSLLETEYRVGLKDLAFEHCAKVLRDGLPKGIKVIRAGTYLSKVFPDRTETAEAWWEILRQKFKDETNPTILKRLRDLLEGKVAAKVVQAWIEEADRALSLPNAGVVAADVARHRRALAEVALSARLDEVAYSQLVRAGTPETLIRLGDLLASKNQWAKAAERYRQAWKKSGTTKDANWVGKPSDALPLYLAGYALVKAGQDKEGKKLIERSHWLPLADVTDRYAFLLALAKRGHSETAQRETELLLKVSQPNSYHSGAALRRLAVAALARKDYLKAADGFEQSMLRCLLAHTNFVQASAYAAIPAQVHQMRARGLLDAGKFDEAREQIELALTASPASVDLPIALTPELDRRDRKKEATALFERSFTAYEKVCQDYPRCSWAHNSAAWLSACCRRNLDKALEHARKAVELAPDNAGYLDTLAEVHFQRGEKDKAVALQKRVVELDPKKSYFRKQQRRIEAGDPKAERPSEEEE